MSTQRRSKSCCVEEKIIKSSKTVVLWSTYKHPSWLGRTSLPADRYFQLSMSDNILPISLTIYDTLSLFHAMMLSSPVNKCISENWVSLFLLCFVFFQWKLWKFNNAYNQESVRLLSYFVSMCADDKLYISTLSTWTRTGTVFQNRSGQFRSKVPKTTLWEPATHIR